VVKLFEAKLPVGALKLPCDATKLSNVDLKLHTASVKFPTIGDEGMPDGSPIFAYPVFGPGGVPVERITRPMKIAAWRGPRATLGVQAKIRRVQVGLVFD
jgi:hypothetical protein